MNRFKSGIKSLKEDAFVECLNSLTKQFVRMTIGSALTFFILGFIFTDKEENNE